jgi:hypothetical protein
MQAIWEFLGSKWPFFLIGGILFLVLLTIGAVNACEAISRAISKREYKPKLIKALVCLLLDCILFGLAVVSYVQYYMAA